ncbi:basic 7S globulin 2 [Amborella trichopoda]|uniref:Peptidase A1 domain-containing protein n=1 Tax=Amborella trichopoda TaxID=13333 RepID=W1PFA1_AMBTC|nr:basic 7S globulin 2 [Amborella trichopoda]ERN06643.1 hypothetical protein AMTR_s00058p00180190 [Amborella trichopoda]|eukprot:XP_006844968.1 basic 7S globulin 2 [Amborella trichopoda]
MYTRKRAPVPLFAFLFLSYCCAQTVVPKTLVAPILKDPSTLQYLTTLLLGTPLRPETAVVHLGSSYTWLSSTNYTSSTSRPVPCSSLLCTKADFTRCSDNGTCGVFPQSIHTADNAPLIQDRVAIKSSDGHLNAFSDFTLAVAPSHLLKSLAATATGVAGLSRSDYSLPKQIFKQFGVLPKFTLCLTRSFRSPGVLFFGQGPYLLQPGVNSLKGLAYTPLLTNPVSTAMVAEPGTPSHEYFIGVKAIRVGGKPVNFSASLLEIEPAHGDGGTKISTVDTYTRLHTSIYTAVIEAFAKEAKRMNMRRVPRVKPFGACYKPKSVGRTRTGPSVPLIELVMGNGEATWPIYGANSMVEMSNGALCLGFVDGGHRDGMTAGPVTSIEIGGHQLEDNVVEFDMEKSRVGLSSSLLLQQTTCADFKFLL